MCGPGLPGHGITAHGCTAALSSRAGSLTTGRTPRPVRLTRYWIVAVPVCPSLLIATTVYVRRPSLRVSRRPMAARAPAATRAPLESKQDPIPGPLTLSLQEKLVATDAPSLTTLPSPGALIVAV